jgi:hypothetical protein
VCWRGRGVRVAPESERRSDRLRRRVVFVPVTLKEMTSGAHLSAAEEGGRGTGLGKRVSGPWAISGSRPKGCRRPLFPFPILFSFFFSDFV